MIACTIIARNYLARARTLARSYLSHHPGDEFFVLVVDGLPADTEVGPGAGLILPGDLPCPYFRELSFKYDVTELCTAIKPTLLKFLLRSRSASHVLYLDPDILVFRELSEVGEALRDASLLLTPQLVRPLPLDGRRPTELDILSCGAFNLGFLALRHCEEAFSFLDWWEERLRDGCLMEPGGRHFVDQKWVDLAPCFFPGTAILRDETYNVAMWNLGSRKIQFQEGGFLVNGRPLSFFHFSGFGAEDWKVRVQNEGRATLGEGSPLARLLESYEQLQEESGRPVSESWNYGYGRFDNGIPIGRVFRRLYLSLSPSERARFPDPFSAGGPDSFFEWAVTAREELDNFSPFLMALYRMRPDVMAAFPEIRSSQRESFLQWAETSGAQEMEYDPRLARCEKGIPPAEDPASANTVVRVTAVSQKSVTSEDLVGRGFDLPKAGQIVPRRALPINGWALGRRAPIERVEVVSRGRVLARAPVNVGRPEVAGSNPGVFHATHCGFRLLVSVEDEPDSELVVDAVFSDHTRVTIGVIRTTALRSSAEAPLGP